MNVDLLSNDPHWMWVVVIAGGVFTVVILGWALLKVFVVSSPWLAIYPRTRVLISLTVFPG